MSKNARGVGCDQREEVGGRLLPNPCTNNDNQDNDDHENDNHANGDHDKQSLEQ